MAVPRSAHLQGVIAEDRFMFAELAATKHSMGYRQNLFGNKECKPTEYHRTMDHCVQGGSPMDRYGQEPPRRTFPNAVEGGVV